VEYPVGAGALLYLAALVAPSPLGVLLVTALASSTLCITISIVLYSRFGARAWRWALATPVFLYAFQNWDVFAIGALLAGLFAFESGRDRAAGVGFGVGAAVKLFPAVVVPPLVAVRLAVGDRRGALRLAVWTTVVFGVVNFPFVVANPSGWWWTVVFQSRRNATWGSAWFYLFRVRGLPVRGASSAHFANVASLVALVAALTWLAVMTTRRKLAPFAAASAAVAILLLSNKVYSPTYDLWLVAFFVLLPIRRQVWVAFCAVDVAVFATVYGYFQGLDAAAFVRVVLPALVAARTALLLTIVRESTRPTDHEHLTAARSDHVPAAGMLEARSVVRALRSPRPRRRGLASTQTSGRPPGASHAWHWSPDTMGRLRSSTTTS
jgi:uncharacterized membrane protein